MPETNDAKPLLGPDKLEKEVQQVFTNLSNFLAGEKLKQVLFPHGINVITFEIKLGENLGLSLKIEGPASQTKSSNDSGLADQM
jgi:hypothetical protein